MREYIANRAEAIADYMIERRCTVRDAAKKFGVSKSTVHKDISERLKILSPIKAQYAKELLEINKSERHIRGGNATKEKYLKFKDANHS
ncbi:MAG: sporulation transcriptional regulator SpoIIID [Clostridia bacterium]|nr:sporulation transcriptional regulator SpoIIID [Clostridia bacterium]MBO7288774.1 sporulation transcriptional regulator SpoIIID [Clostridia bacterium]